MMVELEWYHYLIVFGGGFIAAVMNTLAGYGSIITLTIMMDLLGMPGNVANGTNRVNTLSMSLFGAYGFNKAGKLNLNRGKGIISAVVIGAILGILTAISIDNDSFRIIFNFLIVLLFITILIKPKRWLIDGASTQELPLWKLVLIYFPLGFYGGFIQMGMGLFFLAATVLISKFSLMQGNALKLTSTAIYSILALILFHLSGLVDWKVGLILGVSQALGGYLTARYASKWKNANLYTYRLLLVIVIVVMLNAFGFFSWIY